MTFPSPMEVATKDAGGSVPSTTAGDWARFAAVSAYLALAGLALVLTRRIRLGVSPRRLALFVAGALGFRRGERSGVLAGIRAETGHCYLAPAPWAAVSDAEGRSRLTLSEDGRRLGPAHCPHDAVRREGGGRFSHWGGWIYFSTSDGSDPRTNGRVYRFGEEEGRDGVPPGER